MLEKVNSKKITFYPMREKTTIDQLPPKPASSHVPTWYKDQKQFVNEDTNLKVFPGTHALNATIKRCVPFLDSMISGYMVYLSDDVQVQKNEKNETGIYWRTTSDIVTAHAQEQLTNFPLPKGYSKDVFKWQNEWRVETPPGYSLLCVHPMNRYELPFLTLSGVVDTDEYPLSINFPFLIKDDFEGIIENGTPIVQLIPFKRDSWQSELAPYVEEKSLKSFKSYFKHIERSYKNFFWTKKVFR